MLNSIYDIYYIKFALQFTDMQTEELVETFNRQTRHNGWTSMRAYHDQALIDEFRRRGIDVSAISDGQTTSFAPLLQFALCKGGTICIFILFPEEKCSLSLNFYKISLGVVIVWLFFVTLRQLQKRKNET